MKLILILAVLLFMVMMGISNSDLVRFRLSPFGYTSPEIRSALMYFIFFAVGVLFGGIITSGSKSSGPKSKG